MSHMGQSQKYSVRAYVFRVTPENGRRSTRSVCRKVPGSDMRSNLHLISAGANPLELLDRNSGAYGKVAERWIPYGYTQRILARPSCAERSFDRARRKITNGE